MATATKKPHTHECIECGKQITWQEKFDRHGWCEACDPEEQRRLAAAERFPKCKSCGAPVDEAPRWTTYGGSGLCEACDPAETNGRASREVAIDPEPPGQPDVLRGSLLLDLDRLARNRFNPRQNFDEAELDDLAKKLRRDGQLQPVLVRRAPAGLKTIVGEGFAEYEIVAGERRALAAARAGWQHVRAEEVEPCDDARACELAIAENRDRKDISQVEYARGLQKLADLKGLDPAGLAQNQGLSEQHVRNLLRLLKTPAEWQQLVIEGKLDGTHLRTAAPFLHVPAIAKCLAKDLAKEEEKPSLAEWSDAVRSAAWQHGGRLSQHVHTSDYRKSGNVEIKPTHPRWAELDVAEVNGQKFALNAKLAKKLLDEEEAAWKKKQGKTSDKQDRQAAERKATMTPAERKKHEADLQRKFADRLENWFHDWLRVLCAAAIQPGGVCDNCEQGALWLTAYAVFARPGNEYREREVAADLAGYPPKRSEVNLALGLLEPLNGHQAAELMHAYAPRLLVDADGAPRGPTSGGNAVIYDAVVTVLARDVLGLDVAAAWRNDRESLMREKFWGLHSKDQLVALGEELGVPIAANLKKSEAVGVLLHQQKPLPLPKELAGLVAKVKGGAKKSKVRKPK